MAVSLAGVFLLGKLKELSKIIFKRKYISVIWLQRRPSSSTANSSADLVLRGCDPAAFIQHSNISRGTRGAGCPLLTHREGRLSPNEESVGEETSTQLLLRNETMVGQKGSDGTSSLEEERGGEVK